LCLTFWLGLLAADRLSAARVQPPEETKPEEIKRVIITFDPKEMNYDSAKPQCKKFFGDFDTEFANEQLTPERLEPKARISKKIKTNREELETQKIEEEALKLKKTLEDTIKEIERVNPDSGTTHNLLYIENCAEYY